MNLTPALILFLTLSTSVYAGTAEEIADTVIHMRGWKSLSAERSVQAVHRSAGEQYRWSADYHDAMDDLEWKLTNLIKQYKKEKANDEDTP